MLDGSRGRRGDPNRVGPVKRSLLAVACMAASIACSDEDPAPGAVLHTEAVDLGGATGTRLRYASVDARGEPSEVTGLLLEPSGRPPPDGWPVLAWTHATTGAADSCAPSNDPTLAGAGASLRALAGEGYVVVATDYEGIGTEGDHPYLDARSEARAVVDSVRAAVALVPEAGRRWAVIGHSQGGHAAASTADHAPDLAPDLELVGAVAVAPVAEPADLAARDDAFSVLSAIGFLATGATVSEEDLLTDAGRAAVDDARRRCTFVVADEPLLAGDQPELTEWLERNAIGRERTDVPLLVQQGGRDLLTPIGAARDAVERRCALGAPTELQELPEADHGTIIGMGALDALDWLRDRFAGERLAGTCAAASVRRQEEG